MPKWEYLMMTVNNDGEDGEDKNVTCLNGKDAAIGVDYFGRQYASFYERIYSIGQEGWELAGIEDCGNKGCVTYVFKRLIPSR